MKTKTNIFKVILTLIAVATFFSCDNPVSLGSKLDLQGPVLTIISPTQRQSVPAQFEIFGTVTDSSSVDRMIVTAVKDNIIIPRLWRYNKGIWEISNDFGGSWAPFADASWSGPANSVSWRFAVDMDINGQLSEEGEYTFNFQAWDKGGMSDDNSFKALVLIVDLDPPKVVITNPYLYSKYAYDSDPTFIKLEAIPDTSDEWKDPAYLGKFITQEFDLKWQIEDINEVWSIDISFYNHDAVIDNDPDTPLPENFIYRYYKNLPPVPVPVNPDDYVKLNGSVTVPDLYGTPGFYDGGELRNPNPIKEAVKVVAVCYDAAGNPNQEKTLGYFISWPKANSPWIVFSEGVEPPDEYYNKQVAFDEEHPDNEYIENYVFTVYPGRSVKATAFQAHGVKEVRYTLYECNISGNSLNGPDSFRLIESDVTVSNTAYSGTYSTIFPWEVKVPPFTGYYVFEAVAYSSQGKPSETYTMLFRVHDITFPDFTEGPFPAATDPLFMEIIDNKINIRGTVSDATDVVSLCMVWINPSSENYTAMSQLSYFRNNSYAGWKDALTLTPGTTRFEVATPGFGDGYPYDSNAPNRLWKIELTNKRMDYETNRHLFDYSQEIDITTDLGIGPNEGNKNLKSQIFLFRAQNPDGKCTIITYAPQGDTLAPVIEITNVVVQKSGDNPPATFIPNNYNLVPMLDDGDTLTINGKWWEDSAAYLNIADYFLKNFDITVNNQTLSKLTSANITGADTQEGTWTKKITVGTDISKDKLKDTLVIDVKAKDIGGNEAQIGCSWLIESDNLRLMRISADTEDGIYKAGDKVRIYLEFSKPVKITNNVKPELILNSNTGIAARAVYEENLNYASRQYFVYTVGSNQNTGTGASDYLNVKGLYYNEEYTAAKPFTGTNYPFTWSRGSAATGDDEEVRLTMIPGNAGNVKLNGYYVRTLPTTDPNDYQFTLTAGKHIKIDTTAPTVTSVAAATSAGHYKSGDIYITVTFSKDVAVGATLPSLTLAVKNGSGTSVSTATDNIKVSGKTMTFMYRIKNNDTTEDNQVTVTGYSGSIVDIAGNALSGTLTGTLTGLYIDTLPLTDRPIIRVLSAANINNEIGKSGAAAVDLKNLYNTDLWFAIERGDTGGGVNRLDKFEYTINGGTSWLTAGNITNTPFAVPSTMTGGSYTISARQINKAGNVSPASFNVTLVWDKGNIISRISSTSANGTYTNTSGSGGNRTDNIPITVYFRKNVKFSTNQPRITVNSTKTPIILSGYTAGNSVSEITFNYAVGTSDNTPSGQNLDVTAFDLNGSAATDDAGVNINAYLGLPSAEYLLKNLKQIKVQTGALGVQTAAEFNDSRVSGGLQSDGSYNTALDIVFTREIVKGTGDITIIQSANGYRLPAVITESQFNKYSGIKNVNKYYTRGSNGYINDSNGRRADTSTKFILSYSVDTADSANAPNAYGTDIQKLAEAFRQAESIKLSINANAVKINGTRLTVELTDTNALQVPGVNYLVSYPLSFVQDNLNTPCPAVTNQSLALGGVAKPFVRINKTQDTITAQTGSATQPNFAATQPFQANVRMDCRTPDSTILYFTTSATTSTDAVNWSIANGPLNTTTAPTQPSDPQNTTANRQTYSAPFTIGTANEYQGYQWYVRAKARNNASTAWSVNSEEMAFKTVVTYVISGMITGQNGIKIGDGDQIWIRGGDGIALSSVPGFPLTWDVNEFETVKAEKRRAGIRLFTMLSNSNNNSNSMTATRNGTTNVTYTTNANHNLGANNSRPKIIVNGTIYTAHVSSATQFSIYDEADANGRLDLGGTITFSAVTEDQKMADNSTWKFITWEINVDTYFDIILGMDSTSTAAEVLQYGPRQFAYQRAGWTSYKEETRALPGQHRWVDTSNQAQKGYLNFSQTFSARSSYTGANITYPPAP